MSSDIDLGPASLAALEARLRRDFELLVLPPVKDWLEPRTHPEYGPMLDVAVVGAGMSGLSAAFALKRLILWSSGSIAPAPPEATRMIVEATIAGFKRVISVVLRERLTHGRTRGTAGRAACANNRDAISSSGDA